MLQFLCGFGPRKAYDFFDKIRGENIYNRKQLLDFVSGDIVFKNCSSFFKIMTPIHKSLLDKNEKEKKK
jgi:transcriptional accessory protein Tex/SPT6